jgi:hypothetical protein
VANGAGVADGAGDAQGQDWRGVQASVGVVQVPVAEQQRRAIGQDFVDDRVVVEEGRLGVDNDEVLGPAPVGGLERGFIAENLRERQAQVDHGLADDVIGADLIGM